MACALLTMACTILTLALLTVPNVVEQMRKERNKSSAELSDPHDGCSDTHCGALKRGEGFFRQRTLQPRASSLQPDVCRNERERFRERNGMGSYQELARYTR
eukprot:scaffold89620_cov78-Phaeocystis_antarctica.AAC.1